MHHKFKHAKLDLTTTLLVSAILHFIGCLFISLPLPMLVKWINRHFFMDPAEPYVANDVAPES